MKIFKVILGMGLTFASVLLFTQCEQEELTADTTISAQGPGGGNGGGGGGETTTAGNNLSFPVIWAEGTEKDLRVPPTGLTDEDVMLQGEWWYVWGEDPLDPQYPIFSCEPSPTDESLCIDMTYPGDGLSTIYKAYLQKDQYNFWQAFNESASSPLYVDMVDWGDNLESVDWSLTAKVRTEVVLIENFPSEGLPSVSAPVRQYAMRHVSGWGTDEVHGLQTNLQNEVQYGAGNQATVFSPHARLTIQKLAPGAANLTWDPLSHSWVGDANAPIFNNAVHEAADGPGFYNAEVNVKGKIIYGYTWDLKKLNEGEGLYRLTFSFDGNDPKNGTTLNTFFNGSTQIVVPVEEEPAPLSEEDGGGGTPHIDAGNNLTYIDVNITGKSGGGAGGGGNGGSGGGNNDGSKGNKDGEKGNAGGGNGKNN